MRGVVSDWAPVLVLLAALATSWVTRRNAKDTSALGGFSALAVELRTELKDTKKELRETKQSLEGAETAIHKLEDEAYRRSVLARRHREWDLLMLEDLRHRHPDSNIPDPPPLD